MFARFAHHFRELRAMGHDVSPQQRRNTHSCRVPLEISVEWSNHAALSEPRQNGSGEIGANFVLAESSRLAFGIEALYSQDAEVVIAIVRCDIPYSRHTVIVCRPHDGVQREAVQLVILRGPADKRAYTFGESIVAAHRRITGGFSGGRGFVCVGVTGGLPAVETGAGPIKTPRNFPVSDSVWP